MREKSGQFEGKIRLTHLALETYDADRTHCCCRRALPVASVWIGQSPSVAASSSSPKRLRSDTQLRWPFPGTFPGDPGSGTWSRCRPSFFPAVPRLFLCGAILWHASRHVALRCEFM